MLDFYTVKTKQVKKDGATIIYPEFLVDTHHEDLMVRGKAFYAVWDENTGLWSRNEGTVKKIVDKDLRERQKEFPKDFPTDVLFLRNFSSNKWTEWQKYVKASPDDYHELDMKLNFANTPVKKTDYASKRLSYPLEQGPIKAYQELMGTLYSEEELQKLEWAVGSIISGDSKKIQKFIVLYGEAGSGKSTFLNIVQMIFDGYWIPFNAKELASNNNSFALEAFKEDPLVAIQHDGDLSRIEDNTLLNSIISHETLSVNEKFKQKYQARFKCFLFLGTNRPVKITEAKSGLLRRLIDVSPTGNKVSPGRYTELMNQIPFELGGIADHCLKVYKKLGKHYYDTYRPVGMIEETNDFYNFVEEYFDIFVRNPITTLSSAWALYKDYCDDAKVAYPLQKRLFKSELKNYFEEYYERYTASDGSYPRNVYVGFKKDKFTMNPPVTDHKPHEQSLELIEQKSLLDELYSECEAQYAVIDKSGREIPESKWENCKTKLKDLDTTKTHFVKPPNENHIFIDFDLKNEKGEKDYDLNVAAASHFPKTYAETSKSGMGIHLHYIYDGDVSKLSRLFDTDIEIKVMTGNSALRRKLVKCNNEPIAHINSGLPLRKGDTKVLDEKIVMSEKSIRDLILRNLNKEIHPATAPSIDFIKLILDEAYESGQPYDVSDLRPRILSFAMGSTHQKDKCLEQVMSMKFESVEPSENKESYEDDTLIFYDVEVFSNLFVVVWKKQGAQNCVKMINPTPEQIESLVKMKLVGFNNRKYDNHILYGRMMGYTNEMLYRLSQQIIVDGVGFFSEAYNLSYTDIYDFSSVKQSLKKFEIELGIHHQELGLPWDQPVPEELWEKVADYCINDVLATEAVFEARKGDFIARQIQVKLIKALHGIDMTMNDTTNTLSGKLIFGKNKKPQGKFNWRDLSKPVGSDQYDIYREKFGKNYKFRVFNAEGLPEYRDYIPGETLPKGWSILPFFPEYVFDKYKPSKERSVYLGENIGEGGKVYTEPGMYYNVWDGDITSQHPHSAMAEVVFGEEYTKVFEDIVYARVAIKHKDFDAAGELLNGALKEFLNEEYAKDLAQALKIIINAIYGLTSASFDNLFRDPNNIDNIVAKRGSLFMTLLKREVIKLGYQVCHIKTDSIKIPNADDRIREFVYKFGLEYGYKFETEADFDRFFLENKAVYVGHTKEGEWVTTGDRFKVPYVRKTMFTKESIEFEDLCETKSVTSALYLDMNEDLPNVEALEKEYDKLKKAIDKETPLSNHDISLDCERLQELEAAISAGHNYVFIGRIGLFCPMQYGAGGGDLVRQNGEKYAAAEGTKGYHWMEAEQVRLLSKEGMVDRSYYSKQVDEAFDAMVKVVSEQHNLEAGFDARTEVEQFLLV